MLKQFNKTDYILWAVIAVYTGIIYATLSIVSTVRKILEERYGPGVFDNVYWIFGIIAAALLWYSFRKFRGRELVYKLLILVLFVGIYMYYIVDMKYPIEKIHFLEYGLLGALIFIAFTRHIKNWIAIILSLNVVYWLGLGDEAIQGILVNRVGEIRDCVINLFSGALGIMLWWFVSDSAQAKGVLKTLYLKTTILFLGITLILTALFIYTIHGFGNRIENTYAGRIYSSLTGIELQHINTQSEDVSARDMALYENEALRHLFQREFYFTNDFKASDGTYYKAYINSFFENRILEMHYKRFLEEHEQEYSGGLIAHIGKDVAQKVQDNPVIWSDSLRTEMENAFRNYKGIYQSRVKSRIITSYALKDLLFYCILIFLILGYLWFKIPRE